MTVIQPNSISGVTSITAQGGGINFYRADGTAGDLTINNIVGAAATFTGVLTYEDVTNVDSVGVITARAGLKINADSQKLQIGAGDDLQLWHNATHSMLKNTTGRLYILSDDIWIKDKDDGDIHAKFVHDGAVELYYDNSKKLETTSSGITLSDQLQVNGTVFASVGLKINADSQKLRIGAGDDLEVFHDGNHSRIHNNTGLLLLECDGTGIEINSGSSTENMAKFLKDGAVELYHNNIKKFDTVTTGIRVHGDEGGTAQLQLLADEGDDNQDYWRLIAEVNGILNIQDYGSGNWYNNIRCHGNTGGVELFHNNAKKLETWAGGIKLNGVENAGSQLMIGANGDLALEHDGSNTYIANNTGDLVLQNDANVKITAKAGGTQRFRFDTDGLKFGTDTAAANALDDYEEGVYTISDQSGNGITYTSNSTPRYVKIGQLVYVQFDVTLTNCNNLTTQDIAFNLPFSVGHTYGSGVIGWTNHNKPCQVHIGSTKAYIMDCDGNTSIHIKNSEANNKRFIGNYHFVTAT